MYDTLQSTNDFLKSLVDERNEGEVVVARTQTKGRGRQNRAFVSKDGGLYFSFLLKPTGFPINKLTAMTAVAVKEAIREVTGKDPLIKWVNDLYLDDRKICGILAESSFLCESVQYAVLGIGINVTLPEGGFSKEIEDIAGFLGEKDCRAELLSRILDRIYYYYVEGGEFEEKYRKNSYLEGKKLVIYTQNGEIEGDFCQIDENLRLVVNTKKGVQKFHSGEVGKVYSGT